MSLYVVVSFMKQRMNLGTWWHASAADHLPEDQWLNAQTALHGYTCFVPNYGKRRYLKFTFAPHVSHRRRKVKCHMPRDHDSLSHARQWLVADCIHRLGNAHIVLWQCPWLIITFSIHCMNQKFIDFFTICVQFGQFFYSIILIFLFCDSVSAHMHTCCLWWAHTIKLIHFNLYKLLAWLINTLSCHPLCFIIISFVWLYEIVTVWKYNGSFVLTWPFMHLNVSSKIESCSHLDIRKHQIPL